MKGRLCVLPVWAEIKINYFRSAYGKGKEIFLQLEKKVML